MWTDNLSIEVSTNSSTAVSIENYEIQISRSDFRPMLMYLCRVSFLTTLDIYKSYFKGQHIKEYKENTCKKWPSTDSLWKKLLRLCALEFCNQVLFDLHYWWSEEFCSQQYLLQVRELVTYWDPCKMVAFIYWRVQRFWSGKKFLL